MQKKLVRAFAAIIAIGFSLIVPTAANAVEAPSLITLSQANGTCVASRWNNQAKITCRKSHKYARAKIACRMWPDQYTAWIKNGTSYSGGCPFGVNDVKSGNPVTIEYGNP